MPGSEHEETDPIGRRRACERCGSGHNPHFIQVRYSWEDPRGSERGRIVEIDSLIRIDVGGELRTYWNHQPERMARAVALFGSDVTIHGTLLKIPSRQGSYCFSIARSEDPSQPFEGSPCIVESSYWTRGSIETDDQPRTLT